MKDKKLILVAFIIMVILQIGASASIIYKYENTLITGTPYKFKTAPVDPYDAFRGRYVSLNLVTQKVILEKGYKELTGNKVYAILKLDKDGFASTDKLSIERPDNDNYIIASIQSIITENDKTIATLSLPIDRYYMQEDIAPKAEKAYRQTAPNAKPGKNSYIAVRIKAGFPVIEELYIDNMPVRDFINKK